jgi:hypothetical protein
LYAVQRDGIPTEVRELDFHFPDRGTRGGRRGFTGKRVTYAQE